MKGEQQLGKVPQSNNYPYCYRRQGKGSPKRVARSKQNSQTTSDYKGASARGRVCHGLWQPLAVKIIRWSFAVESASPISNTGTRVGVDCWMSWELKGAPSCIASDTLDRLSRGRIGVNNIIQLLVTVRGSYDVSEYFSLFFHIVDASCLRWLDIRNLL